MTNALFADVAARTLRGLLLPYGELSSPSVSKTDPVMFSKGTVEIPADPSALNANRLHSQFAPVARFTQIEETDAGIVAHFAVAKTEDGDRLLAEAADVDETKRPRLSAEIRGLVREGAKAVKAVLTGAAFVPQGAFASAALFSIAEDEALDIEERITAAVKAALAEHTKTNDIPSEDPQQKEVIMTASAAVMPDGLTPPADTKKDITTESGLFAALATAAKTGDKSALEPYASADALFAISTIQNDGPTGKAIAADTLVPQFVGELWKRRNYERRIVPLFAHENLTSLVINGWRWVTEPEVGDYAGNVAEIPSNAVDTEPVTKTARRLAGGHKLDRRYLDFGDTAVYSSYFQKMAESYSRKSDARILADVVAAASVVTPGAVPSGIAKGLAAVVDGALAVIATENTPSFALVSAELWRDIVLTGDKDVLGYLSASMGLEEGNLAGFKLLPAAVGTGKVIVGAKEALSVYELGGAPIRVEGIDPHHGAVDPALFGYCDSLVHNGAALASVTTV